jgi:hypothetical protein
MDEPGRFLDLCVLSADGRTQETSGRRKGEICWVI